jgi:hypothetical protein
VAEEVLPRLGHLPSTPPAFVVISVAEPLQVDSSGRVPGLQSVEPGGSISSFRCTFLKVVDHKRTAGAATLAEISISKKNFNLIKVFPAPAVEDIVVSSDLRKLWKKHTYAMNPKETV